MRKLAQQSAGAIADFRRSPRPQESSQLAAEPKQFVIIFQLAYWPPLAREHGRIPAVSWVLVSSAQLDEASRCVLSIYSFWSLSLQLRIFRILGHS